MTFEALRERGWVRLNVPTPYLPYAEGGLPDAEREVRVRTRQRMADMGIDPLPTFTPPYEFPETAPELAARYPLTLISSPAHQFLNTTFVNIDSLRRQRASRSACFTRRMPSGAASRRGCGWWCTTTAARSRPSRA